MTKNANKSRSHILIRNTLWNFISQGWLVFLAFVTTPYILHTLGKSAYGILTIATVIIGYFAFLDLGLGKATVKYVSEYYAKKEYSEIHKTITVSLCVFLLMGLFGALVIVLATSLLVRKVLNIPPELLNDALFVFYFSALGFLLNMPLSVFRSVPVALQRQDIVNKVRLCLGTLQVTLTITLLVLGFFIKQLIIMTITLRIIKIGVFIIVSKKLLPGISLKPDFNKNLFGKLFKFGVFISISKIAIRLSGQFNKFIIGVFMPISSLPYYSIPYGLSSHTEIITRSMGGVLFPAFSQLDAQNEKELLQDLFLRTTKYVVIATLPLLLLFTVFAHKFLLFWIGEDFALHATIPLQLLAAGTIISTWAYTSVNGAQGLNRPDIPAKIQVLQAVLNIGLCLLFIPRWGVTGAAIAWSGYRFIVIPVLIYIVSRRLFGITPKRFFKQVFSRLLVPGIGMVCLALFVNLLIQSFLQLLFLFLILCTVYIGLLFFYILDSKDKKFLSRFLKSYFYKKKGEPVS